MGLISAFSHEVIRSRVTSRRNCVASEIISRLKRKVKNSISLLITTRTNLVHPRVSWVVNTLNQPTKTCVWLICRLGDSQIRASYSTGGADATICTFFSGNTVQNPRLRRVHTEAVYVNVTVPSTFRKRYGVHTQKFSRDAREFCGFLRFPFELNSI